MADDGVGFPAEIDFHKADTLGMQLVRTLTEQIGGRLELFEAKWSEVPTSSDSVNLEFVRNVVGKSQIAAGAIVCRAAHSFPLAHGFRALPVNELK